MEPCITATLRRLLIISIAVWAIGPVAGQAADDCSPSASSVVDLENLLPADQAAAAANAPFAVGTLFKVSREGLLPSYLLGTLHLPDARLLALAEQQLSLVRKAKTVVLELPPARDGSFAPRKKRGAAPLTVRPKPAHTAKDLLRPAEIDRLKRALARRGIGAGAVETISPAILVFALEQSSCEPRGPSRSMDQVIAEAARAAGREIVGLESLEEQLAPFDELSREDARDVLLAAITQAEVAGVVQDTTLRLYLQRKGAVLLAWTRLPRPLPKVIGPSYPARFLDRLIDERNVRMHDRMLPLLGKGNAFVAIGILHLSGETGILNRLVLDGYTVEAVN